MKSKHRMGACNVIKNLKLYLNKERTVKEKI